MENPTEDFDNNARGTLNVLEKARKDKTRLIFASSAAVYGNPEEFPTAEGYGFHPISCYGLSKVVGEQYCQMYRQQYGLDITITRFSNVYGSRCHGVIHDFLDKLQADPMKLTIIGTGQQSRDLINVADIVEALVLLTDEKTIGETYNLGFGETTKIVDLAKMMLKILNLTDKTVITTTGSSWQGDVYTIGLMSLKPKLNWAGPPKSSLKTICGC
jgi:UDP-glucose 4-epimerase